MAGALQHVLGTQSRVDHPKGLSCPAVFDVDTAQFHDIRRETTPASCWRYVCILIDAQDYLFEVEMNAEAGRRLYETIQRVKQSPLLERVYRQIAMPLGNSRGIIYPQRCGRSLTEPPRRPTVSDIAGDLRSAVSAGSETLAERGRLFPASCLTGSDAPFGSRNGRPSFVITVALRWVAGR